MEATTGVRTVKVYVAPCGCCGVPFPERRNCDDTELSAMKTVFTPFSCLHHWLLVWARVYRSEDGFPRSVFCVETQGIKRLPHSLEFLSWNCYIQTTNISDNIKVLFKDTQGRISGVWRFSINILLGKCGLVTNMNDTGKQVPVSKNPSPWTSLYFSSIFSCLCHWHVWSEWPSRNWMQRNSGQQSSADKLCAEQKTSAQDLCK